MQPESPVIVGLEPYEIRLGAEQPNCIPLSVLRSPAPEYATLSRWVPTPEERQLILEGADIYVLLWTYGMPYPPTRVDVMRSTADPELYREQMQLDKELDQRMGATFAAQELKDAEKEASNAVTKQEVS